MSKIKRLFKAFSSHEISGISTILFLLCAITAIINPNFISSRNIVNLLRLTSFTGFVAIGMTYIIIGGGIDLSVGSLVGLGGVVCGLLLQKSMPVLPAILIGTLSGAVFGFLAGWIITKLDIPPFIVTLGNMYVVKGVVYILSDARPIYPFPEAFNQIGTAKLMGIPYVVYMMVILLFVSHYVLTQTVYGRSLVAVGGNERTARTSGINVKKIRMISYVLMGALAAFTGILISARMNSAVPGAGDGWEMKAIASAIIGGTSVLGGIGSIPGAIIGAGIMAVLENAMVMLRVSVYWQNIVIGTIIVLAVVFDQFKRKQNS